MPYNANDLYRESIRKKKCYCFKGGTKLANSFGAWDHDGVEVPEQSPYYHQASGIFLLDHALQSTVHRKPAKKSDGSCACRAKEKWSEGEEQSKFHHFYTLESYMRHYRESKQSLYSSQSSKHLNQEQSHQYYMANNAEPDLCLYYIQPAIKSIGNVSRPLFSTTTTSTEKGDSQDYSNTFKKCCTQPVSFYPLRADGKGIFSATEKEILPTLEASMDHYWAPVNAVYQKRHSSASTHHSLGYYELSSRREEMFPSLRRNGVDFSKNRYLTAKSNVAEDTVLQCGIDMAATGTNTMMVVECPKIGLEYGSDTDSQTQTTTTAASTAAAAAAPLTTTYKPFAGPGRLLSGKLLSNSFPIKQESLHNLSIGRQRESHTRSLSRASMMSQARNITKGLYMTKKPQIISFNIDQFPPIHNPEDREEDETFAPSSPGGVSSSPTSTASKEKQRLDHIANGGQEEQKPPPLSKLNITYENSDNLLVSTKTQEDIISLQVGDILPPPPAHPPQKLDLLEQEQNHTLFCQPKKLSISFGKPLGLLYMQQQQQEKSSKQNLKPKRTRQKERRRCSCSSTYRHRIALDEGTEKLESVFGVQEHHETKCALRSKERRKKFPTDKKQLLKIPSATGGERIRVFLTTRTAAYHTHNLKQSDLVDFYGE